MNPTATATPTPAPAATSGEFPGASNTGGRTAALTSYTGSTTISTLGAGIDAKQVNGSLLIKAANVVISRTKVNGNIVIEPQGSVRISDSTVDGNLNGSAVGQYNVTMRRVEVVGARPVSCNENRDIQDSCCTLSTSSREVTGTATASSPTAASNMLLRHNTLACDSLPTGAGGACSAAVAAFGDFALDPEHTYDNNLFVSSPAGYCMYAGYDLAKPYGKLTKNVQVINNVFQRGSSGKCAVYGLVAAVAPSGNGNVFSGNVRDDGQPVLARNS